MENALQRMKHLCTHPDCVSDVISPDRDNHKLLNIKVIVSMFAAVQNIHQGHRQLSCIDTADVAVQGESGIISSSLCYCQRHTQYSVCPKVSLVFCAIQLQHYLVYQYLLRNIYREYLRSNLFHDICHCISHTLAKIP